MGKMYSGYIKPGSVASEAVKSRQGRFIGTMLGDRLGLMLAILHAAEAADGGDSPASAAEEEEPPPAEASVLRLHTKDHPGLKYDVIGELGEGSFCSVFLASHKETEKAVAIKAEMKMEEFVIWEEI